MNLYRGRVTRTAPVSTPRLDDMSDFLALSDHSNAHELPKNRPSHAIPYVQSIPWSLAAHRQLEKGPGPYTPMGSRPPYNPPGRNPPCNRPGFPAYTSPQPGAFRQQYSQSNNKFRSERRVIIGSNQAVAPFLGGVQSGQLFVYRVERRFSVEDLHKWLTGNSVHVNENDLECVSTDNSRFLSFKLVIPITDLNKVMDPSFWPNSVGIRRYYAPKPKPLE